MVSGYNCALSGKTRRGRMCLTLSFFENYNTIEQHQQRIHSFNHSFFSCIVSSFLMDLDNSSTRTAAILSVILTTIGLCCFIWQMVRSGWLFYTVKKPLYGLVFMQTILGVILCVVTLSASLVYVDCTFILMFSVVGVNLSDMALQTVLLWKAYLGNNRNRIILFIGVVPIILLFAFICANITIARSSSEFSASGVCSTAYPTVIVIIKAVIDCSSNTFLSWCFILVIYRHYRVLGSSVHKTLIKEGLIYW
ncbi:hypothetical protein BX666DRAFT_249201 [Dichotomocladium elegans]|nr:hypothetical protein BX666DRAFT_249201 [Dichotomocladium elegans]